MKPNPLESQLHLPSTLSLTALFLLLSNAQGVRHLAYFPRQKRLFWNPVRILHTWEALAEAVAQGSGNEEGHSTVCAFEYGYEPAFTALVYQDSLTFNEEAHSLSTTDPALIQSLLTVASTAPQAPKNPREALHLTLAPAWPKSAYERAFAQIQEYILSGDVYQINLTYFFKGSLQGDPAELFALLLEKNPAQEAAYLDLGTQQILSASPEKFITLKYRFLETTPVKGTRPRGKTPAEDQGFKAQLLTSEKEASELNMITDLLRNDLGHVSKVGTVRVTNVREIQENPSVFHTYSTIQSELETGLNAVDVLRACLPGGSISGCPKKRACELIAELEAEPRHFYTGVLALIHPNGDMDSSVLIRSLIHENGQVALGMGGGIVADSHCDNEFKETLQKVTPFLALP